MELIMKKTIRIAFAVATVAGAFVASSAPYWIH
jgi:hypothetical protein